MGSLVCVHLNTINTIMHQGLDAGDDDDTAGRGEFAALYPHE